MCAAANKGAKHAMTAVRVLHDMRHHGMPNETAWAAMRRPKQPVVLATTERQSKK